MRVKPNKKRNTKKAIFMGTGIACVVVFALSWWVLFGRAGKPQDPATLGANPILRQGRPIVPTVKSSRVVGWPASAKPVAPAGFTVTAFADRLDHPRWLYELPNGDILVAESSTISPKSPSLAMRLLDWLRRNDGSTKERSPNHIMLLRDTNNDGRADVRTIFLQHLNQPFGMALLNDTFYVANTDSVMAFRYKTGDTRITGAGKKILTLAPGGYNNHWTRNIFTNTEGTKLYVTIGSSSNAGEYGLAAEKRRAVVLEINPDGSGEKTIASGIRNPNGLALEPATHALWAVVNERDLLGDDAAPDYLTRVRSGDFYGWPWAYWNKQVDTRVKPPRPDLVAKMQRPDYSLGAHTAPLGLTFYTHGAFPAQYHGGAFIGEHGSWNRSQFVGYEVVYVPFENGMPSGLPQDFLTGFQPDPKASKTYGRPAGVIADRLGRLLVADDAGNTIWGIAYQK